MSACVAPGRASSRVMGANAELRTRTKLTPCLSVADRATGAPLASESTVAIASTHRAARRENCAGEFMASGTGLWRSLGNGM